MTEQLIIRLASESTQKNHWLIWSETENEIIASGEVDDALQLNLLTEKAQNRLVICLLPGVDVNIRAVPIKGKYNRHIQQALPYLLEDDLATDVEKLHFNVFSKERDLIHVAYCTQKKMHMWLHWLSEAQLNCLQMIPEGLVLPIAEEGHWSAIELGEQVIVRENKEIAWSCDRCMLSIILESKAQEKLDDDDLIKIDTYSALECDFTAHWEIKPAILPMQLLSNGCVNNKVNMLSGPFRISNETHKAFLLWRLPVIFIFLGLILLMFNMYMKSTQNEQQTERFKVQVEQVYVQAFPMQRKLSYTRIKKKIKGMLNPSEIDIKSGFLLMLNDLVPAFVRYPKMRPSSIKFDDKNQQMQLLLSSDNFQSFESFIKVLEKDYSVKQGALNNIQDRVVGTLNIRKK